MKIYVVTNEKIDFIEKEYVAIPKAPLLEALRCVCEDNSVTNEDIVGVSFNSKYFIKYDNPLLVSYIEDKFEYYDLIMPYYSTLKEKSAYDYFSSLTGSGEILDYICDYLKNKYSSFVISYEYVVKAHLFSKADNFICRKYFLKEYYEFASDIFNKLYEKIFDVDESPIHDFLFRIFLVSHKVRVKEENSVKKDYTLYINEAKKIELKQQYIKMRLEPLISFRKETGFDNPLADLIEISDDFEGKIPVFVCWFQGEENMPPLIKACVDSIKRNLPMDITSFRLITFDNMMEYVTLTEDIINKFNEGIISYTHLSDALRMELLYRYGGMWIDATYYISREIPREIFTEKLFSTAFDKILWGLDIMKSRWNSSFWFVRDKGNKAIQFVMEGLWQYWEIENELIDYFVFDYILDAGYSSFEEIKNMVDSIMKSPAAVYDLQLRMNQECTKDEIRRIKDDSFCYKLNRRNEYKYYNDYGKETVYGYILQMAGITENLINENVPEAYDKKIKKRRKSN